MDFSPVGFPNPFIAKELQAPDPSMSRHCLTRLSFGAGLTERMTSFTDGWSVNHMRPKFSGTCYELQGFEIPARVGRGREAKHDVDHIQLQDNNSPTSSEQTAPDCRNVGSKRKACKDLTTTSPVKKSKGDESTAKCPRSENASKEMSSTSDRSANLDSAKESSTKPQEPPKDYIHVRARRGQATDSHSLAERVRREKISERMKFLQALVPGCSKVTGKALMLEEIINYVQSLQREIEFLSVRLATVDPSNIENLLDKELAAQATRSPETTLLGPDPLASHQEYQLRMQFQQQINDHCNMDLRSYLERSTNAPVQLPPQMAYIDNFEGSLPQTLTGVYDGDLQTIVQMGSTQSRQGFFGQGLDGPSFISPGFLKVEY